MSNANRLTPDTEQQVKAVHASYMAALGSGDLMAVAEQFTFPAVFKGFLDDVAVAADADSLASTYQRLIAAAPKAARTDVSSLDAGMLRPGVYSLTMNYEQFDGNDASIHLGSAVYLMKQVGDELKLFAVL